ncbi:MAG: hypothetical protein ACKPCP_32965 [Sphaerospermopsis kisseleviana]
MSNLIQLGIGEDGEPVIMQKVHQACVLVYCAGNSASPFEFNGDNNKTAEENARQFAGFLYKFRLEKTLEGFIHE